MVIFHSYVSLPEGKCEKVVVSWELNMRIYIQKNAAWMWAHGNLKAWKMIEDGEFSHPCHHEKNREFTHHNFRLLALSWGTFNHFNPQTSTAKADGMWFGSTGKSMCQSYPIFRFQCRYQTYPTCNEQDHWLVVWNHGLVWLSIQLGMS
jgi:hypothetical protein